VGKSVKASSMVVVVGRKKLIELGWSVVAFHMRRDLFFVYVPGGSA
jgi:hypothetical protein